MNTQNNDNIEVIGASENNLKHIDVTIPKGKMVVFAGISGSGKSSLAFDTVAVESNREWQQSYPLFLRNKMPHYDRPKVDEIRNLTPAIVVDQRAIGANSRSTVGTAVDVAPLLRLLDSFSDKNSIRRIHSKFKLERANYGRISSLRPLSSAPTSLSSS